MGVITQLIICCQQLVSPTVLSPRYLLRSAQHAMFPLPRSNCLQQLLVFDAILTQAPQGTMAAAVWHAFSVCYIHSGWQRHCQCMCFTMVLSGFVLNGAAGSTAVAQLEGR
jgi:hypothetical protein